ncbi:MULTISPECIES: hypothetical protein [unclassified Curtobacterium]|uniref:hypothetical protein n=1 Tax=unclassified Curtobacterium TaxID=257496 RepID=UPI0021DAE64E|nr:hypothetical protein [Curtobacterium sp. RIT-PI-V]
MSSTPLFDSIAQRRDQPEAPVPTPARAAAAAAPTSPMTAPVRAGDSTLVPAALVAAIDDITVRVTPSVGTELRVQPEQLVLVETVADAITRAVVDAVAIELDRIARDGVVRA